VPKLFHEARTPVEFRPAWRLRDPDIERDAIAFWKSENLLPPTASIETRLSELCVAGYAEGRIVALSTVLLRDVDFLGARLAMFRCAVAKEQRRNRLATVIAAHSREALEKWSLAHPEEDVRGMATVVQNADLDAREARAIYRSSGLAFIGWTAQDEQFRLAWFEHARVPHRGTPRI